MVNIPIFVETTYKLIHKICMMIAPRIGTVEYVEVVCLKRRSIIDVDWGNFDFDEGGEYLSLWMDGVFYVRLGGFMLPLPVEDFTTKADLRNRRIEELGL